MAGPPGAGKNTVIRALGLNAAGLKLQDVDQTLAYLNQSKAPPANKADYDRSLNTTLRRQSLYQQSMLGLIINSTGRDYESLMRLNKELREAGYDTFMLFVDVDYSVAVHRIHDREKNATNPADRRPVDMPYFEKAYEDSKKNVDFYALMFGNQFAVVSNNEAIGELTEDDSAAEYQNTLNRAAKKIGRFLKKPLTPTAQAIVAQATTARAKTKG
jgi:predicted kinase